MFIASLLILRHFQGGGKKFISEYFDDAESEKEVLRAAKTQKEL